MIKMTIKNIGREIVRRLGEYCNENPKNEYVYGLYLLLVRIVYG